MYVGMNTPLISAQLYCYDGSQISQNQYQEKCMGSVRRISCFKFGKGEEGIRKQLTF